MKKIILFSVILFLTSTLCFTLSPKWFTDLEKVFPSEKFIRAIGEGSSITLAKKSALSELSSFFEQTIQTKIYATKKITQNNFDIEEFSNIQQDFLSSTNIEIYQVEYSDIYFNKKNQRYYVCAYINKENLWNFILKKIDSKILNCNIILEEIKNQSEPLRKVFYYKKIKDCYYEFYKVYQIALCTYPNKCDNFTEFSKTLNEEIIKLKKLIGEISVKINTTGDKRKIIESKIFQLLAKTGFLISSQKGMYQLNTEIFLEENEFNGIYSTQPKIKFSIYKNSQIIKSFVIICENFSTYNYQTLERKQISLIEEYLDKFFLTEFFE